MSTINTINNNNPVKESINPLNASSMPLPSSEQQAQDLSSLSASVIDLGAIFDPTHVPEKALKMAALFEESTQVTSLDDPDLSSLSETDAQILYLASKCDGQIPLNPTYRQETLLPAVMRAFDCSESFEIPEVLQKAIRALGGPELLAQYGIPVRSPTLLYVFTFFQNGLSGLLDSGTINQALQEAVRYDIKGSHWLTIIEKLAHDYEPNIPLIREIVEKVAPSLTKNERKSVIKQLFSTQLGWGFISSTLTEGFMDLVGHSRRATQEMKNYYDLESLFRPNVADHQNTQISPAVLGLLFDRMSRKSDELGHKIYNQFIKPHLPKEMGPLDPYARSYNRLLQGARLYLKLYHLREKFGKNATFDLFVGALLRAYKRGGDQALLQNVLALMSKILIEQKERFQTPSLNLYLAKLNPIEKLSFLFLLGLGGEPAALFEQVKSASDATLKALMGQMAHAETEYRYSTDLLRAAVALLEPFDEASIKSLATLFNIYGFTLTSDKLEHPKKSLPQLIEEAARDFILIFNPDSQVPIEAKHIERVKKIIDTWARPDLLLYYRAQRHDLAHFALFFNALIGYGPVDSIEEHYYHFGENARHLSPLSVEQKERWMSNVTKPALDLKFLPESLKEKHREALKAISAVWTDDPEMKFMLGYYDRNCQTVYPSAQNWGVASTCYSGNTRILSVRKEGQPLSLFNTLTYLDYESYKETNDQSEAMDEKPKEMIGQNPALRTDEYSVAPRVEGIMTSEEGYLAKKVTQAYFLELMADMGLPLYNFYSNNLDSWQEFEAQVSLEEVEAPLPMNRKLPEAFQAMQFYGEPVKVVLKPAS